MKVSACILCGIALAACSVVGSAQVSLGTVVDLAQRNSSSVKLAQADVQKAAASLSESRDAFIPSMSFGSGLPAFPEVGFTGNLPSIWDATVQSMVFSMPQFRYIQAARRGLQAAQLNLKDAREQVALDAAVAYIDLDTVTSELDAARQQEVDANRLVTIEQQRTQAGVDAENIFLQARLTAAELKLKRIHLEARAATLTKQISLLTGLPTGSIKPDHGSIPEIPAVRADTTAQPTAAQQSALMAAKAKERTARGDLERLFMPQVGFGVLYNRNTTLLNDINKYYANALPTNDFSSGFSIRLPLFDAELHAKAKESAADALRAKVEAEQAERQTDLEIAQLTGNLRELDAQAEIAGLKQQIANDQLKTVLTELEVGNGAGGEPGAPAQLSPSAEQQARIDERQKFEDALDAGLNLSRARLNLLRALGHMQDWLNELHAK
jgi:outer membrane protein TolC